MNKKIAISDIFRLPGVIKAFHNNQIFFLEDINIEKLNLVFNEKGIGAKKVVEIKTELANYGYQDEQLAEKNVNYQKLVLPEFILNTQIARDTVAKVENGRFKIEFDWSEQQLTAVSKNFPVKGKKNKEKVLSDLITSLQNYNNWRQHAETATKYVLDQNLFDLCKIDLASYDIQNLTVTFKPTPNNMTEVITNELIYFQFAHNKKNIVSLFNEQVKLQNFDLRQLEILHLRSNNQTLQEIGDNLSLTRERVRQILAKQNKILTQIAEDIYLYQVIENAYFFTGTDIISAKLFDSAIIKILEVITSSILLKKDNQLLFVLNPDSNYQNTTKVRNLIDKFLSKNSLKLTQAQNKLSVWLGIELTEAETAEFLEAYGFKIHVGENFYKGKSKGKDIALEFVKVCGGKVTLDSSTLQRFLQFYFDVSGKHYEDTVNEVARAVSSIFSKLVDSDNLDYLGNSCYKIVTEEDKISSTLIDRAAAFIELYLASHVELTANRLYEEFEEQLDEKVNHYEFYSILRRHFKNKFHFGRRNTLTIRKLGTTSSTTEQVLIEYLKQHNNHAEKEMIEKDLGWKEYTINQWVSYSNLLIINGNVVELISSIDNGEFKQKLNSLVNAQLVKNGGYLFVKQFWQQFLESDLVKYVKKHDYFEDLSLFSRWLKNTITVVKLNGYTQILYQDCAPSDAQLLKNRFGDKIFNRTDYHQFYEEFLGYSSKTAQIKLYNLLNNKVLLELNDDKLYLAQNLPLSGDYLKLITDFLNNYDKDYIYLTQIDFQMANLPKLPQGLTWNAIVMSSYVDNLSQYRNLTWKTENIDVNPGSLNDPFIICKSTVKWQNLIDLTGSLFQQEFGNNDISEITATRFLIDHGILTNDKLYKLPKIIKGALFTKSVAGNLQMKTR